MTASRYQRPTPTNHDDHGELEQAGRSRSRSDRWEVVCSWSEPDPDSSTVMVIDRHTFDDHDAAETFARGRRVLHGWHPADAVDVAVEGPSRVVEPEAWRLDDHDRAAARDGLAAARAALRGSR